MKAAIKFLILIIVALFAFGSFLCASNGSSLKRQSNPKAQGIDSLEDRADASFSEESYNRKIAQYQKALDEERKKNKQLEESIQRLEKENASLKKIVSETLNLRLSSTISLEGIESEIRIKLDECEQIVPKILSEDDIAFVKDMTSDEPAISKRIMDYHAFVKNLKGKRIIILEDKSRED